MIKRYYATKDNTITNAYGATLTTRGSDANMGASDILEVFSIYGQTQDSSGVYSSEEARIIIEFDIEQIKQDREAERVPEGSRYFLRLFNARHGKTLPTLFDLEVVPLEEEWSEGVGLDMEDYSDLTYGKGSSWNERTEGQNWTTPGGHFPNGTPVLQTFYDGDEDLNIDVTDFVESWINQPLENKGLIIKLPQSLLTTELRSYYTKMFFARGTSNFFKKPTLEARWNSQIADNRTSFYSGESNDIYFYNIFRNQLSSLTGPVTVSLHEELGGTQIGQPVVATKEETGIYKATVNPTTSLETIYDVWSDNGVEIHSGSIEVLQRGYQTTPSIHNLVVSVLNKQSSHSTFGTSRFYFYIRDKDWSPNIYTVATSRPNSKVYDTLHYKISKISTSETIFDYDLDNNSTLLSYDSNGNFFDLDISMLQPNYDYEIRLALYDVLTKSYQELPFKHRFRVVDNEY